MQSVCVLRSDGHCTVVDDNTVRLGFCVVNGLRQEHAEELVKQRQHRPFESLDDFKRRVPFAKNELRALAELGALNCFAEHRRAAMWRVAETLHDDLLTPSGVVAAFVSNAEPKIQALAAASASTTSPLFPMTLPERVKADYETMNLTTGPHPMKLLRQQLPNISRPTDFVPSRPGSTLHISGT